MSEDKVVNPFQQVKKTDWSKKARERLEVKDQDKNKTIQKSKISSKPSKPVNIDNVKRVAKSFKVYPGKIVKDFDKRVNKLQVKYDDLDYDKDYVDSGKYIMFLMSLSEKIGLHEIYEPVNEKGELEIDKKRLKKLLN